MQPPATDAAPDLRRRVRRLRWALAGTSVGALVAILVVAGLLFYWHAYLLGPTGTPFERGPFLIRLDTSSAQLAWRLRTKAAVELRAVGPDGETFVASDGRFSGLAPATRYSWAAATGGVARAAGSFTTAPTDLSRPIRFVVFGDYGSGNDHERAVGRIAAAQAPDFVLTAGDNSYLVAADPLFDRNIFDPLHDLMASAPLWATLGEHDLFLDNGRATIAALHSPGNGHDYVVRYGPIQIIVIGLQAEASNRSFIEQALRTPGPELRFILVHRPIQPSNPILPVLLRGHVTAILAGHLHRYERRVVGGVPEFTVGTGGEGPGAESRTRPSPDAVVSVENIGLLRVDATATAVAYTFVDERGRVLDRSERPH
jgi:tartrate-resistant acid phosphatase type 5